MRQKIFIVMTAMFMAVIFFFSGRTGEESSQDSYRVGTMVCKIFVRDFDQLPEERQIEFAMAIDHPVRKCAHATEYAVLAFLVFGAVGNLPLKKRFITTQLIASCYAASDEFHQLFIAGRDGRIIDVLIDSCGALCMLVCIYIVVRFIEKKTELH